MSGPEITPETEKKAETPAESHVSEHNIKDISDSKSAVSAEPAQDSAKQETDKLESPKESDSAVPNTENSKSSEAPTAGNPDSFDAPTTESQDNFQVSAAEIPNNFLVPRAGNPENLDETFAVPAGQNPDNFNVPSEGNPDSFVVPVAEPEPITEPVSSVASENEKKQASSLKLTQTHVSHLLSDVLQDQDEEPSVIQKLRFPMILDCLLGVGLLIAVGGFTIGLVQMYLIHSASQSISEQKYKAAISILKGAPMPQVFGRPGSDTEELLSKARYLDAIETIEAGADVPSALKELGKIRPGSRYFVLAQQAISENTEPAPLMLQGGTETIEKDPLPQQKESLVEKTLKEESK